MVGRSDYLSHCNDVWVGRCVLVLCAGVCVWELKPQRVKLREKSLGSGFIKEITLITFCSVLCWAHTLSSCRWDVVWSWGQSSDPQSGRAILHRPARVRSGTRVPDVCFLPRTKGMNLWIVHSLEHNFGLLQLGTYFCTNLYAFYQLSRPNGIQQDITMKMSDTVIRPGLQRMHNSPKTHLLFIIIYG